MTIQNRVSLILIISFAVLAPLTGMAWDTLWDAFCCGCRSACSHFCLVRRRNNGRRGCEAHGRHGVWLGWNLDLVAIFADDVGAWRLLTMLSCVTGTHSCAVAYTERFDFMRRLARKDEGVPYGIALGLAGLLTFPSSPLGLWVIDRLAHT